MAQAEPLIRNISDTALLAAVYRARDDFAFPNRPTLATWQCPKSALIVFLDWTAPVVVQFAGVTRSEWR